jgi:hypothetical protein
MNDLFKCRQCGTVGKRFTVEQYGIATSLYFKCVNCNFETQCRANLCDELEEEWYGTVCSYVLLKRSARAACSKSRVGCTIYRDKTSLCSSKIVWKTCAQFELVVHGLSLIFLASDVSCHPKRMTGFIILIKALQLVRISQLCTSLLILDQVVTTMWSKQHLIKGIDP